MTITWSVHVKYMTITWLSHDLYMLPEDILRVHIHTHEQLGQYAIQVVPWHSYIWYLQCFQGSRICREVSTSKCWSLRGFWVSTKQSGLQLGIPIYHLYADFTSSLKYGNFLSQCMSFCLDGSSPLPLRTTKWFIMRLSSWCNNDVIVTNACMYTLLFSNYIIVCNIWGRSDIIP